MTNIDDSNTDDSENRPPSYWFGEINARLRDRTRAELHELDLGRRGWHVLHTLADGPATAEELIASLPRRGRRGRPFGPGGPEARHPEAADAAGSGETADAAGPVRTDVPASRREWRGHPDWMRREWERRQQMYRAWMEHDRARGYAMPHDEGGHVHGAGDEHGHGDHEHNGYEHDAHEHNGYGHDVHEHDEHEHDDHHGNGHNDHEHGRHGHDEGGHAHEDHGHDPHDAEQIHDHDHHHPHSDHHHDHEHAFERGFERGFVSGFERGAPYGHGGRGGYGFGPGHGFGPGYGFGPGRYGRGFGPGRVGPDAYGRDHSGHSRQQYTGGPGYGGRCRGGVDRILADFVERGWVWFDGDRATLTDEGRAAHDAAAERMGAVREALTEGIDSRDLTTALATLEAMARNLGWATGAADTDSGNGTGTGTTSDTAHPTTDSSERTDAD